jgi:hypothetical protein
VTFWTLLAAIVASGTALWIAYRVYPFQKTQDRKLELQREQRKVYREFIDEWLKVWTEINSAESAAKIDIIEGIRVFGVAMRLADAALVRLTLSASQKVLECAGKRHRSLYKTHSDLFETLRESMGKTLEDVPQSQRYALFETQVSLLRDQDRKNLEELVNLMRSEEFSSIGKIEMLKPALINFDKRDETKQ